MPWKKLASALVPLVALFALAGAHVRLMNPSNKNPLFWQNPASVSVTIHSGGSDNVTDGSHVTALRNAIDAWNADAGTTARLVENADPLQQARTDWQSSGIHLILFDETNESGFFPAGSGVVAVTPVFFFSNGRIADADILFNGNGFQFTTSAVPGRFDVQDIGAHELGHLLGLDHSGWAGATMYPYVDTSILLHRSLSLDDVRGLRDAYPNGTFASVSGTVQREDESPVQGAHVVARSADGRTAAGALSDATGAFELVGLDAGTYSVYATPLDFPVSANNLTPGHVIETDFESTVLGTLAVAAGEAGALGTHDVGADVSLSLGRIADDYPLRVVRGAETSLLVRGSGLFAGGTLTASDPAIDVQVTNWAGSSVQLLVTVPADAASGHVDLRVDVDDDTSILPAALEITPPDPAVALVSPSSGDTGGGVPLSITGSDFEPGSRVVIGDRIYRDGETASVVDPSMITLVTEPMLPGLFDVVVIGPSGVEGRAAGAFAAVAQPSITAVFPPTGDAAGGTSVIVSGANFTVDTIVRIGGVAQSDVTLEAPDRLSVVTESGLPGQYIVEVENPGGAIASSAYAYVNQSDPTLSNVEPAAGPTSGGQTVVVSGTSFTADSEVFFGADPATGQGGTPAASVSFIDDRTLEVVTPPQPKGATAVMVRESDTSQASLSTGAFTFKKKDDDGGGCAAVVPVDPPGWRGVLAGSGWALFVFAVLLVRASRRTAVRVRGVAPLV